MMEMFRKTEELCARGLGDQWQGHKDWVSIK